MGTRTGHKIKTTIQIFKDAKGEFRWHAIRAGRIVGDSGEGYTTKDKCKRSLNSLINSFITLRYVFDDVTKKW